MKQRWSRLDHRMIIAKFLKEVFIFMPPYVVALLIGDSPIVPIGSVVGFVLLALHASYDVLSTKYRISHNVLEYHHGIIDQHAVYLSVDKIREVDFFAHFTFRLLGLVRVEITTANPQEHNGRIVLEGLSRQTAESLKATLMGHHTSPEFTVLARNNLWWIRYAPFSYLGLTTTAIIVSPIMHFLSESPHANALARAVNAMTIKMRYMWGIYGVLAVYLVTIIILFIIIAAVGFILRYWGFELAEDTLGKIRVHRGFVSRIDAAVERARIRGVQINQNLFLRWVNGAHTKALLAGRGDISRGLTLLPLAPRYAASVVAGYISGEKPEIFSEQKLFPPGKAAEYRRISRGIMFSLIPAIAWAVFIYTHNIAPIFYGVSVLAIIAGYSLGLDRYHNLGFGYTDKHVVFEQGSLNYSRTALDINAITGWTISQTLLQRRTGLATVGALTAAGNGIYYCSDIDKKDAARLIRHCNPDIFSEFVAYCSPEKECNLTDDVD